jgi:hypothetical protein
MSELQPNDQAYPSKPPVDFQLERLNAYLYWCDEHYLSFLKYREAGDQQLGENELEYLRDTIENAIEHFRRLEELLRDGHGALQRDPEPPLLDPGRLDWLRRRGVSQVDPVVVAQSGGPFRCPCCGIPYLRGRACFEVCPICLWEDDGQDDPNADEIRGGPNGKESLTSARANFQFLGVCQAHLIGQGGSRRIETFGPPARDDDEPREDFSKVVADEALDAAVAGVSRHLDAANRGDLDAIRASGWTPPLTPTRPFEAYVAHLTSLTPLRLALVKGTRRWRSATPIPHEAVSLDVEVMTRVGMRSGFVIVWLLPDGTAKVGCRDGWSRPPWPRPAA